MFAKQLNDNLAAYEHSISSVDLQQYIFSGLDSTYDSIVTTLTTTYIDSSMENFQAYLLSFDICLEFQNNLLGATPTANVERTSSHTFKSANANSKQPTRLYHNMRNNTN